MVNTLLFVTLGMYLSMVLLTNDIPLTPKTVVLLVVFAGAAISDIISAYTHRKDD